MRDPYSRRIVAFALCSAVAAASRASASAPSPPNSIVPPCISLVGSSGSVPAHAAGAFQVVVRDLANNPIVGAHVVIDLTGCPDLHFCADQLDPAMDVDCTNKRVGKYTGANGAVSFTLLGGSNGSGRAIELIGGGKIYEDGTLVGSPTVSAFDLDGANGVGINDLSVWLTDFGTLGNPTFGRSDLDCSGTVGINDFAVWLTEFSRGDQIQSCGATCP